MRSSLAWTALACAWLATATAAAQAPAQIPVQGYLTDAGGAALTGEHSVTIALYDSDTAGTELYTETQTVMVEEGWFTAYVGDVTALDLATFRDNGVVFAELTVGSETLSPRFQLASVPYAGYAEYSGDAQTVGGMTAAELGSPAWSDITGIPADIADGDDDTDTTYTAGAGLSLSGTTFSADATYLQRRVSDACAAGSSIRAINSDGTVVCEVDDSGSTSYSAGTGLILSGTTFSADTTYMQRRVSGSCPAGQSIRAIGSDGTVTCEVDTDTNTTYSAGTGLTLSGTTFNADSTYLQRRVSGTCSSGQAIRAISSTGSVTCEPIPTATGVLLDQFIANSSGHTASGFHAVRTSYTAPANARAAVYGRCSYDASGAGQQLGFRAAVRSPASSGTVSIGSAYYFWPETAAADTPIFNAAYDTFDLTAGATYDFGVNFSPTPPSGGSNTDWCSVQVQIFSR